LEIEHFWCALAPVFYIAPDASNKCTKCSGDSKRQMKDASLPIKKA
jgi:hypothetical protein